jgi:hypothetical protein
MDISKLHEEVIFRLRIENDRLTKEKIRLLRANVELKKKIQKLEDELKLMELTR